MSRQLGPVDANRLRWEALVSLEFVQSAYRGERIPRASYAAICNAARRLKLPEPPKQPIA